MRFRLRAGRRPGRSLGAGATAERLSRLLVPTGIFVVAFLVVMLSSMASQGSSPGPAQLSVFPLEERLEELREFNRAEYEAIQFQGVFQWMYDAWRQKQANDMNLAKWEQDAKYAQALLEASRWRSSTSGFTLGDTGPPGSGYCTVSYLSAWFGSNASAAASVCRCESGGNPSAQNASGAHGLFQLMPQYHGWHWSPSENAAYAAQLSNGGNDWSAWVCKP